MATYGAKFPEVKSDQQVCCAYGCGTIGISKTPMENPCYGTTKFCCCLQGVDWSIKDGLIKKGAEAGKGFFSIFQKQMCCVSSLSFGHCSCLMCDKTYCGPGPMGENTPVTDMDLKFMEEVWWILYAGIGGCGLTNQMSPFCEGETTFFCCEYLTETDKVISDTTGIMHKRQKTCCLVTDWTCPPKENTGCMVFTKSIGAAKETNAREGANASLLCSDAVYQPAQQVM